MPPQIHMATLVLGGARSGKSRFAEGLVMRAPLPWTYIATAEAFDEEMTERIALHRRQRGADWTTIDAPLDLAGVLQRAAAAGDAVLVDCLTLWLSNLMLAERDVEAECERLVAVVAGVGERKAPLVLVSNEVGLGIVPDNALARRFRDAQGRLNQQIAAVVPHVVLMAAGLPMVLKSIGRN
jgi:adenosylcobinamide kinase / adenosylcobinamide-phosphate guanylyltransferase